MREFRIQNGEVTLADACREASSRFDGATRQTVMLGDLATDEKRLAIYGEAVASLDDYAWQLLAKLLGIPVPYMCRMGSGMRSVNVNYWLSAYSDKEATLIYRSGSLLDAIDGVEISAADMLDAAYSAVPDGIVLRAWSQTNSTIWDIVDIGRHYESARDVYYPGMRVVLKKGLNAPEIVPILVADSSCGTIECADRFEPLNIKSMGYGDIMRMVSERVRAVMSSHDALFGAMGDIEGVDVPSPRRRIALYCREHAVPGRVTDKAISIFDDTGLDSASYGDIIGLFSTLGFLDGVKRASDRKMQRLAGHIVTRALSEKRCAVCDSLDVGA